MLKTLFFIFLFESAVNEAISKSLWGDVSSDKAQSGGHEVDIKQYPYHVSLVKLRTQHFCGGSILTPYYVLTEAFCLEYIKDDFYKIFYKIRAGSSFYNKSGDIYNIVSLHMHPKFNDDTFEYNAGLIKTEKMVLNGVTTRAVQLPDAGSELKPGTTVVATGFGFTDYNGNAAANLRAISVPAISSQRCGQLWDSHLFNVTDKMICAQSDGTGEPGGPIVEESTMIQYGILIMGSTEIGGLKNTDLPELYTYIPVVLDWIKEQSGL